MRTEINHGWQRPPQSWSSPTKDTAATGKISNPPNYIINLVKNIDANPIWKIKGPILTLTQKAGLELGWHVTMQIVWLGYVGGWNMAKMDSTQIDLFYWLSTWIPPGNIRVGSGYSWWAESGIGTHGSSYDQSNALVGTMGFRTHDLNWTNF